MFFHSLCVPPLFLFLWSPAVWCVLVIDILANGCLSLSRRIARVSLYIISVYMQPVLLCNPPFPPWVLRLYLNTPFPPCLCMYVPLQEASPSHVDRAFLPVVACYLCCCRDRSFAPTHNHP